MNLMSNRFKRKIDFWRRLNANTNVQCLRRSKIMCQVFMFFQHQWDFGAHDELERLAWGQVAQRQPQDVQSSLGRNIISPFGRTCSRELVWTTSEKVYTHDACDHIISARHCSEKNEPKSYQRLRTMVSGILEQQQQNMFTSQKERESQQHTLRKELRKVKDSRSCMSKSSCSKGGKCSFEYDTAKKGQGKGNRSRSSVKRRQFRRTTICEKEREKSIWEKLSS